MVVERKVSRASLVKPVDLSIYRVKVALDGDIGLGKAAFSGGVTTMRYVSLRFADGQAISKAAVTKATISGIFVALERVGGAMDSCVRTSFLSPSVSGCVGNYGR